MKKRIMLLLCLVCTMALLGGCGTEKKDGSDKKSTTEESGSKEETKKIEYNVDDYVELGDYKGLKVELGAYEVTDEDVRNEIETILLSYPVYEDLDKDTVADGDFVNIDYEGLKDGTAFVGGTAEGAVLEIGSNSFIDGFEEGLIGAKVGDEVALDLTFPENYQNEELAGQAVVFNVKVNKIVSKSDMTYDMLDDEFVKANLSSQGYENVDEFKKGVREELESGKESTKNSETHAALVQEVKKVCKVNGFPEGLLEQKKQEYVEQFTSNLKMNFGMELEEYLKTANTTEEQFDDQVDQYVTENLETQLIIEAIAKKENFEIEEKKFADYKKSVVEDFGYESEEALLEQYGEEYVKTVYLNEQIVKLLEESAEITYSEDVKKDGGITPLQEEDGQAGTSGEDGQADAVDEDSESKDSDGEIEDSSEE